MRLSDRNLGYLVMAAVGLVVLLFLAATHDRKPLPAPPPKDISTPAPKPSPAVVPRVPPDLCGNASRNITKLHKAGLVNYWIAPPDHDGLASLVYVEPKLWQSMLHEEKTAFVDMFIVFFMCYNQDHPGPGQVPFFAVKNMSTKERLARGWVTYRGAGSPPGTAEVFK